MKSKPLYHLDTYLKTLDNSESYISWVSWHVAAGVMLPHLHALCTRDALHQLVKARRADSNKHRLHVRPRQFSALWVFLNTFFFLQPLLFSRSSAQNYSHETDSHFRSDVKLSRHAAPQRPGAEAVYEPEAAVWKNTSLTLSLNTSVLG